MGSENNQVKNNIEEKRSASNNNNYCYAVSGDVVAEVLGTTYVYEETGTDVENNSADESKNETSENESADSNNNSSNIDPYEFSEFLREISPNQPVAQRKVIKINKDAIEHPNFNRQEDCGTRIYISETEIDIENNSTDEIKNEPSEDESIIMNTSTSNNSSFGAGSSNSNGASNSDIAKEDEYDKFFREEISTNQVVAKAIAMLYKDVENDRKKYDGFVSLRRDCIRGTEVRLNIDDHDINLTEIFCNDQNILHDALIEDIKKRLKEVECEGINDNNITEIVDFVIDNWSQGVPDTISYLSKEWTKNTNLSESISINATDNASSVYNFILNRDTENLCADVEVTTPTIRVMYANENSTFMLDKPLKSQYKIHKKKDKKLLDYYIYTANDTDILDIPAKITGRYEYKKAYNHNQLIKGKFEIKVNNALDPNEKLIDFFQKLTNLYDKITLDLYTFRYKNFLNLLELHKGSISSDDKQKFIEHFSSQKNIRIAINNEIKEIQTLFSRFYQMFNKNNDYFKILTSSINLTVAALQIYAKKEKNDAKKEKNDAKKEKNDAKKENNDAIKLLNEFLKTIKQECIKHINENYKSSSDEADDKNKLMAYYERLIDFYSDALNNRYITREASNIHREHLDNLFIALADIRSLNAVREESLREKESENITNHFSIVNNFKTPFDTIIKKHNLDDLLQTGRYLHEKIKLNEALSELPEKEKSEPIYIPESIYIKLNEVNQLAPELFKKSETPHRWLDKKDLVESLSGCNDMIDGFNPENKGKRMTTGIDDYTNKTEKLRTKAKKAAPSVSKLFTGILATGLTMLSITSAMASIGCALTGNIPGALILSGISIMATAMATQLWKGTYELHHETRTLGLFETVNRIANKQKKDFEPEPLADHAVNASHS